jgi:hypothetical protein
MHARTRPSLYEQLQALPEGLTGEILDGRLYAQPRPSLPHGLAASSLVDELVSPFQKGCGGPGAGGSSPSRKYTSSVLNSGCSKDAIK